MSVRQWIVAASVALALMPSAAGATERASLGGPISDFWNQVKRDWADSIPGLRSGSQQTYQWISLVYGSPGEDSVLDNMLAHEMRTWSLMMQRKWVRSMFWKKPYDRLQRESFYGSRALRKNLVVMGTPASNPLIVEMTEGTPFVVDDQQVRIGQREYRGTSLVLAFIRPNPMGDGSYVLVLAAPHRQALLGLRALPLGPTDYVLFRGSHVVESGFLDWSQPDKLTLSGGREINPDHQAWHEVDTHPVRVHFHPAEFRAVQAEAFGKDRRAGLQKLRDFLGLDLTDGWDEYLYPSLDVKMLHTSSPGSTSVDLAAGAVHRVWQPGDAVASWPAAMVMLWRAWGATDLQGLLYGLSLLPDGELEGQSLQAWAARLAARGELARAEQLIPRQGFQEPDGGSLQILGLGAFLQHVLDERGLEAMELFYRQARTGSFRRKFREVMGTSLSRAEADWRKELPGQVGPPAMAGDHRTNERVPSGIAADRLQQGEAMFLARQDTEARRWLQQALEADPDLGQAHLLLARLAFRAGNDMEAQEHARQALLLAGNDPALAAWARVTLGRAHAARGELQAARLELTDPAVSAGPDEPRILADYWLESLGISPSRAAAARYLSQQAEIDLQSYRWEDAEKRVLRILTADPGNVDAHHQLARIRLHKYQYWYDFAALYNELFPGTTPSDPEQYFYLAQSSQRESRKGALLASGGYTHMDLDLGEILASGPGPRQSAGSGVYLPRAGIGGGQHRQHFRRAEGYFLAGDWKRAASNLKAILAMGIPVSNFRALVLFRLGFCEQQMERWDDAGLHLVEANRIVRDRGMKAEILRVLQRQPAKKAATEPPGRKR